MIRAIALVAALAIPPAIYFPTIGAMRHRRLEHAEARLAQLDARIAETRKPVTPLADVRALATAIASENNVRLTRFDVSSERANVVDEQSIAAEVVGSAEATAAFLRRIDEQQKINAVTDVTLTKDPAGWRTSFVMTTFAAR